jgi:Co/Zn/Cd efflux system component
MDSIAKKAGSVLEKVKTAETKFKAETKRLSAQLESKQTLAAEHYIKELGEKKKRVSLHLASVEVIKAANETVKVHSDVEEKLIAADERRKAIEAERLAKLAIHHSTVDVILHAQR